MDDFLKAAVFSVATVVFFIWRASATADRLEATVIPGQAPNRGLYFWGSLIFFVCIAGGFLIVRLASDQ